jgi:hypothetical protein
LGTVIEAFDQQIAGQIPSIPTSKTAFYLAVLHKQNLN